MSPPAHSGRPPAREFMPDDEVTLRATISMVPPPSATSKRPWAPSRMLTGLAAFGLLTTIAAQTGHLTAIRTRVAASARLLRDMTSKVVSPIRETVFPHDRADKLVKPGRSPLAPGFLTVPPSFESSDGAFDL